VVGFVPLRFNMRTLWTIPGRRWLATLGGAAVLTAMAVRTPTAQQAVAPAAQPPAAQTPGQPEAMRRGPVYVIPISGTIDMGLAPFVQRVLQQAEREKAAAVVLDINTFGGRVDAAVLIRDALLASPVHTVAFINRRAISAGALISLAANRVVMTPGATIGAATPVQISAPGAGGGPSPVDEKTVSYVRKEFRATADSRGRPPLVAEAMVDADVVIDGLVEKGKLLTLTTAEALAQKVADRESPTLEALLAAEGLTTTDLRRDSPNWGEQIVRMLTHPLLASLLLSIATLGILIELRTPGFGVAGALGVTALVLVLGGHWIVKLVGWEELLLVSVGLALLLLEVFVIPGFGIAGIVGIIALGAGVTLTFVGQGATGRAVVEALSRVGFSMTASLLVALVLFRFLPGTSMGRRLTLETGLEPGGGDAMPWHGRVGVGVVVGDRGTALSMLRPMGTAEVGGVRLEVIASGGLVPPGSAIEVTRVDGPRVEVRAVVTTERAVVADVPVGTEPERRG
jgi:membrane-bound serine protease (ClpP class)